MFLNAIAYCLYFYEKPYNFMVNYFAIRYACRKHASKVKNEKGYAGSATPCMFKCHW